MDYYKAALELHEQHKGKIEVTAKVPEIGRASCRERVSSPV